MASKIRAVIHTMRATRFLDGTGRQEKNHVFLLELIENTSLEN